MIEVSLVEGDDGLGLEADLPTGHARLVVDFLRGPHRRRIEVPTDNPLVKAAGKPPGVVVDLTMGFARDALVLAARGFQVIGVEREPLIVAVVDDARARALSDRVLGPICARLSIVQKDARDVLEEIRLDVRARPDVIVIDPMFDGDTHGNAAVQKDMQLARALATPDVDAAAALVRAAVALRINRVLVKRPRGAAPLVDGVTSSRETKTTRIDVYTTPR